MISKTLLPHLEENLSNTIKKEIRCLGHVEINTLFPILEHSSFNQCDLFQLKTEMNSYELRCENTGAASGNAVMLIDENQFLARLNIKMGAKNMTMTQRVEAKKLSDCDSNS